MKSIFLRFSILGLLVLGACFSTQNESISSEDSDFSKLITVECKENYEKGEKATFVVKNESNEKDVFLFQPNEIHVEKQTEKGWKRLNILYCPCGASCPPPPEWEVLKSHSTKQVKWNLNEEWCGEIKTDRKIPETKKRYAGAGTYRFVLKYSVDKGKEIVKNYTEFELK